MTFTMNMDATAYNKIQEMALRLGMSVEQYLVSLVRQGTGTVQVTQEVTDMNELWHEQYDVYNEEEIALWAKQCRVVFAT